VRLGYEAKDVGYGCLCQTSIQSSFGLCHRLRMPTLSVDRTGPHILGLGKVALAQKRTKRTQRAQEDQRQQQGSSGSSPSISRRS
jgi:hypothetical protein